MQKIYFHKTVNLKKPFKELISISVDESIQYKLEKNGMRAIGSIVIHGEYDDNDRRNKIIENIDLDILATMDKIEDKRDFHIKVEDFDYSILDNKLKLIIQTNIYGVKNDEDKHIHVNENQNIEKENQIFPHIEELLREDDKIESLINDKKDVLDKEIEDEKKIIDDDDDIGTYYFYVVQSGDSYHTISSRYKMNEKTIRNYNDNKDIIEGQIIIIPYIS